jgi:hypothetical protein
VPPLRTHVEFRWRVATFALRALAEKHATTDHRTIKPEVEEAAEAHLIHGQRHVPHLLGLVTAAYSRSI